MHNNAIDAIKTLYNDRADGYEDPFHTRQAQEFIECAKLKDGESVLDLACGTGLLTIPAKKQVGRGTVVGVDITHGMLEVARRKTKSEGLDITLIERDITDLTGLDVLPETIQTFDVIMCASALLLLRDPLSAVNHWTYLLAPSGRFLTDVLVERSMIAISILAEIGPTIGLSMVVNSSWVESEDSLRELLNDAGLVVERVYKSEVYEEIVHKPEDGPDIFEKIVANPMFQNFAEAATKNKAQTLFAEKFREMASEDGLVHEQRHFYMGIARKSMRGQ